MRAVAAKASSQENAAKSQKKAAQNQTQPTAPAHVSVIPGFTPLIQRKSLCPCDGGCPTCSGLQNQIQSLKGSGQSLSAETRGFFEPRFGRDFSSVRVHTGSQAAQLARSLNAKAFTRGEDIVFGAGHYSPETSRGKHLLGHELTHVVQQQGTGLIQRVGNPITEADLPSPTAAGISTSEATLRRFMREVFRRQVLLWTARGATYLHEVPPSDLITLPSGYAIPGRTIELHKDIQHPVTNMIDDARAEMNRQNGPGGPAAGVTNVGIRSGYRSAVSQFGIWTRWAPVYYSRTQADRRDTSRFPGGEHSDDAAQYLAEYTNQRVFSPGYSPHQQGTAVDVSYRDGSGWAPADTTSAWISRWRSSWFFQWLDQNAPRYGFFQNPNLNEPWHWEYDRVVAILLSIIDLLMQLLDPYFQQGDIWAGGERTGDDRTPGQED